MNVLLLLQLLRTLHADIVLKKIAFEKREGDNTMITVSWHGMTVIVGPNEGDIGITLMCSGRDLSLLANQLPTDVADELRRVWVEIDPTLASLSDILARTKS